MAIFIEASIGQCFPSKKPVSIRKARDPIMLTCTRQGLPTCKHAQGNGFPHASTHNAVTFFLLASILKAGVSFMLEPTKQWLLSRVLWVIGQGLPLEQLASIPPLKTFNTHSFYTMTHNWWPIRRTCIGGFERHTWVSHLKDIYWWPILRTNIGGPFKELQVVH